MLNFARGVRTGSRLSRQFSNSASIGCFDVVVVGGGIVGVATARQLLLNNSSLKVAIVEKENCLAKHQSGHNSGVIHAGIYYKPGSTRAKLCLDGFHKAYEYCDRYQVPYKKVGKLIVATNEAEEERLDDLLARGQANGVPGLCIVEGKDICQIEPYCVGTRAIYSPNTGIIDWGLFTQYLGRDVTKMGGKTFLNFSVDNICIAAESKDETVDINKYPVTLVSRDKKSINAGFVLTCAGLYSDKVAELTGGSKVPFILPVRGEYLSLKPEKSNIIRGNIYPVPDPRLPFLGVHFTPTMSGDILIGPNAVLATKREGYTYADVNLMEFLESVSFRGTRSLMLKYFSYGLDQFLSSLFIGRQLKELQKYVPCIKREDLIRGPTGVRAQALDVSGEFVDDFFFEEGLGSAKELVLHCRNAPSPAATASMAIGTVLADKVLAKLARIEAKKNSPMEFVAFEAPA